MKHILLVIIILSVLTNASAQWRFRKYTTENGLSQNQITGIVRNANGMTWISTYCGLNKFDGNTFYNYRSQKGRYKDNCRIQTLFVDSRDRIFTANLDTKRFVNIISTNTNDSAIETLLGRYIDRYDEVISFCESRKKDIYIAALQKVVVLTNDNKVFVLDTFNADGVQTDVNVMGVAQDNHDNMLFNTPEQGLFIVKERSKNIIQRYMCFGDSANKNVTIVLPVSDSLLVGTVSGLYLLRPSKSKNIPYGDYTQPNIKNSEAQKILNSKLITCIKRNPEDGTFWIGTHGYGVFILSPKLELLDWIKYDKHDPFSIDNNYISVIFFDGSYKKVWIGTANGLFTSYSKNESVIKRILFNKDDSNVKDIIIGNKGNIWVITDYTLYFLNNLLQKPQKVIASPESVIFRNMAILNNRLYIGSNKGVFIYDIKLKKFLNPEKTYPSFSLFKNATIYDVRNYNKGILLCSRSPGMLYFWDGLKMTSWFPEKSKNNYNRIYVQNDSVMIVFAKKKAKLYYRDKCIDTSLLPPSMKGKLVLENIDDVYMNSQLLFVTTDNNGLFRMDMKTKNYEWISKGLNGTPYKVQPAGYQKYWMSSNNGLFLYDDNKRRFIHFTEEDNIQGRKFNMLSFCESDTQYFYGGASGLNYIDKKSFLYSPPIAKPALQKIRFINNDSVVFIQDNYTELVLDKKSNSVELTFAAPVYEFPDKINYLFKLEGLNKDWITPLNSNTVTYTNIPSGKYNMMVQLQNFDGDWSAPIIIGEIVVKPEWYETLLFRLIVTLIVLSIITLIVRLYYLNKFNIQKGKLKQQLVVQKERERISKDLHDDVSASLTGMNLMLQIAKRQNKTDKELSDEMNKYIAEVNNKIKEVIWELQDDDNDINSLINFIIRQGKILFQETGIQFNYNQPYISNVVLSSEVRSNTYLIVKELMHNSLRHSKATEINCSFSYKEKVFAIAVSDNGLGFDENEIIFGNGIKNIQERCKKIKATLNYSFKNGVEATFSIPIV